ncbi:capsule assembly Wzi family protein [Belliella marina]|uniref:Capsule assembly Wzi family protein n=1 Tax=Belliella marina TaxID=1644146 RepID=A0ABW4VI69_9BACT
MKKYLLLIILGTGFFGDLFGQSIPAGFPILEDYIRRAQLLGELDSTVSFSLRPINPRLLTKYSDTYQVPNLLDQDTLGVSDFQVRFFKDKARVQLLPFQLHTEWNSHHPYPQASRMIPNRGFQTYASAGLYLEAGPLTVQLQPEVIWAQNKDYDIGFPKTNNTEYLERFGESSYRKFLPGQSSVRLNLGAFSAGLSTENIWWGPGQFNALLFSNNAFGFEHFTLNTRKPAKTFLGSFEGQIIAGYLKGAEFQSNGGLRNDDRYLNGILLSYQPKWTPGLSVGVSRVYQQYESLRGDSFSDYFPIFSPFQKVNQGFDRDAEGRDQQATVFARWVIPQGNAEIYFEFGRRDHEATWRGVLLNPEHSRAYLIGFSKLFPIDNDAHIQTKFEMFHQQESINIIVRYDGFRGGNNWGGHSPVRHGFTHYGQMLGPGIGPSSNIQTLETAWVKGIKRAGLRIDRLNRHQDIYVKRFNDMTPEQRWVDLAFGLFGDWKFNKLLVSTNLNFINSFNYQWQLDDSNLSPKGKDVFNFQGTIRTVYLF